MWQLVEDRLFNNQLQNITMSMGLQIRRLRLWDFDYFGADMPTMPIAKHFLPI
jgi:hypothetical protein